MTPHHQESNAFTGNMGTLVAAFFRTSSSLLLIMPDKEQISREEDNNPIEAQEANISAYISTTVTPTEGVLTDLQGYPVLVFATELWVKVGSKLTYSSPLAYGQYSHLSVLVRLEM